MGQSMNQSSVERYDILTEKSNLLMKDQKGTKSSEVTEAIKLLSYFYTALF